MLQPRENFSPEVKRRLAQRAGYRCSMCYCLTIGPSDEGANSVNLTGVAAHIAAAAPGGRRYSNLPPDSDQRSKIENGIWLCAKDADLIDGDEIYFTSEVLKGFRIKHEARIQLEHRGLKTQNGVITKIEMSNFGLIRNGVNLEFGNLNIILGDNGVGKTLICEMISALTDKKFLDRWKKDETDKTNSYCHIHYYKNELHKFGIFINGQNETSFSYNDAAIPFLKSPFSVFFMSEDIYVFRNRINRERENDQKPLLDETDLITWLSLYFNLSVAEFCNVIHSMGREKKFFINDIRINELQKDIEIIYSHRAGEEFHSFYDYSGGEKQRIILDIALRIATYYAKFQTTILLLENTAIGTIDKSGLNKLLEIVNGQDLNFQFFFTSMQQRSYFETSAYCIHELVMHTPEGESSTRRNTYVTVKRH